MHNPSEDFLIEQPAGALVGKLEWTTASARGELSKEA